MAPSIQIIKLTESAVPFIRELSLRVWPQTYASIITAKQIDYMMNMIYSEDSLRNQIVNLGHQFITAYEGSEPMGFASYSPKVGDESTCRLHKIYVMPEAQGKGVGKLMVDFILAEMDTMGADKLELNVNRHNPARSFYERLGFSIVLEEDIDIGNGYFMNDYVMRRKR